MLVAQSDLRVVQLIRGAIAKNNVGEPRPRVRPDIARGGNNQASQPSPKASPSGVCRPTIKVEAPPAVTHVDRPATTERVEICDAVEPALGPLPAPWQTLLREKVWNRPVATEAALPVGNAARRAADAYAGPWTDRLVDAVL